MKKIILSFMIFVLNISLMAQTYQTPYFSKLKPTLVRWEADGTYLSLKNAKSGVVLPHKLTIEVYIDTLSVRKNKNFSLEFRWYYYLSTRRKLMSTDIVPISKVKLVGDAYLFTSTKQDLTKGWWEVQIFDAKTKAILRFAKITNFQIFLK